MSMIPVPPDVSVLNCGAGDMTFSFDPKDPQECARAERVVRDMLKRGYMLFAKVKGKLTRVMEFDEKKHEYIVADGPEAQPQYDDGGEPPKVKRGPGRPRNVRVPARGTSVTGIAPTSGG